jgi:hypothetical protein
MSLKSYFNGLALVTIGFGVACQSPPTESNIHRVSAHSADNTTQSRALSFRFEIEIPVAPKNSKIVRVWIPQPQVLPGQDVSNRSIKVLAGIDPKLVTIKETTEKKYGNVLTFIELPANDKVVKLQLKATCKRQLISDQTKNLSPVKDRNIFLKSNTLVPINDTAKRLSNQAIGARTGKEAVRQLFDATFDHMVYDKSGSGWGQGSFTRACDIGSGNCTDFHAYFIGMSRAQNIPARFEIGVPVPADKDSGTAKGYHCWAFAEVDGYWWPVDISEAWKHKNKKDSYFGELDPHRITLTTGRDLILEPAQEGAPLNYFVFPYAEVDGQAHKINYKIHYKNS